MFQAVRLEGEAGKLEQVQPSAGICAIHPGNRLLVTDANSGLVFLVDTGANISVIPPTKKQKLTERCDLPLYAVNGSKIKSYGTKSLVLDLKLRRAFRWEFIVADVTQPILGADFLGNYKLLPDIANKRLIDTVTNLDVKASAVVSSCQYKSTSLLNVNQTFHDVISQYPEITRPTSFKEPPKHSVYHHIDTSGPPVYARARPLPPDRYVKVKEEFRKMQEMGICRPSKSPWASPLHVVPKPNGDIRPCGDYRRLNAITKPDRYPVPRLQDFTYVLANKKVFSRLDINRAYHFIPIHPDDIEKTAIITPFGLFEFTRMSFGLRNAAQTFQRFMNTTVLVGLDFLFSYIDDVIIASDNEEQHREHVKAVFKRFSEFGITINIAKCEFNQEKVSFLGFEVSSSGIKPLQSRVQAILDYPKPETVEELRRFLGMVNFYRSHIPKAVESQMELNKFIHHSKKRDKTKIPWDKNSLDAFEQCKLGLQKAVTLSHPRSDVPVSLMCDASDTCIGSVLQQQVNGKWEPLGYFSKKLSDTQKKYCTYDRELLAIYMSIQYFRKLFEGRELIIFTDHKPLTYAFSKLNGNTETPRRMRHLLFISEFTTDIRHVSGKNNVVADSLSRVAELFCPTTLDFAELATAQDADDYITNWSNNNSQNSSVIIKKIVTPLAMKPIYCEISKDVIRPYLPEKFRKQAFENIHGLSHPGIKVTKKLVAQKYFWPGMNKDVGLWAKACIGCQRAKIQRHTISDLGKFPDCDRFEHIHIDIVGPLIISEEGYRYCLTIIDRFTKWPEAIPLREITAEVVARTLYECWISRFGCPVKLTSDQGRQFESSLFSELMKIMGIEKIRTTAFHPQSNGMIERWHRSMKAALMARLDSESWVNELPTVLLGLRVAIRSDTGRSAAELTYGRTIRLPGDFYTPSKLKRLDIDSYVGQLRSTIGTFQPSVRSNRVRNTFIHPDLKTCKYVFVRNDTVRKPLQPPYDGPYRVISRRDKHYVIEFPNREACISIDRLKPAFLIDDNNNDDESSSSDTTKEIVKPIVKKTVRFNLTSSENSVPTKDNQIKDNGNFTTRSGRIVKRTRFFDDV